MRETVEGAQNKIDRHIAAYHGGGASAAQADPLGFGFPFTFDPRLAGASSPISGANRCVWWRVTGAGTITKIGLAVAAQSGNICVAVHSNSGVGRAAVPGTRRATSGSVACPAVGYAEIALGASVAVVQGDWFGLAVDNNTATFSAIAAPGNAVHQGLLAYQDTAFPIPSTPTPLTGVIARFMALVGVA
jgi:hypothetical protein